MCHYILKFSQPILQWLTIFKAPSIERNITISEILKCEKVYILKLTKYIKRWKTIQWYFRYHIYPRLIFFYKSWELKYNFWSFLVSASQIVFFNRCPLEMAEERRTFIRSFVLKSQVLLVANNRQRKRLWKEKEDSRDGKGSTYIKA